MEAWAQYCMGGEAQHQEQRAQTELKALIQPQHPETAGVRTR
jgi:hypothetical protein